MASIETAVKEDSSSEAEDLSESAKLVVGGPEKRSSNPLISLSERKKSNPAALAGNGVVLTGEDVGGGIGGGNGSGSGGGGGADMDDLQDDSETARLLGGSKEQICSDVKVVKETMRKIIKVDRGGEKTEIIIERAVHTEGLGGMERPAAPNPEDGEEEEKETEEVKEKAQEEEEEEEEEEIKKKKDMDNEDLIAGNDYKNEKDVDDEKERILIITDDPGSGDGDGGGDNKERTVDGGGGGGDEEAASEIAPSDTATDSYEQDTDPYDLYQTVGSMTPNSLSNADVFRSLAATVASSQATFISADDTLGPPEEAPPPILPPTLPRSPLATEADSSAAALESVDLESGEAEASQSTPRVDTDGEEAEEEEEEKKRRRQEAAGPVGGQADADPGARLTPAAVLPDGVICKAPKASPEQTTEDDETQREVTFEEAVELAPVVMYPAQVHQYCPPGLEGLLDCGQLVIHKENLRHNRVFNNNALQRMEVIDISRKVLFYVEEESPPLSEKSFLFKVYNRNKQEVMQIYNPQSTTCIGCGASWHCFRKCHFQTLVFAPLGQVAGFVKRSLLPHLLSTVRTTDHEIPLDIHTYFVQEYLVLNSQEDVMLIMRGGPDDLEIYTPDLENELGRLAVHHWHGIMHEVRRSHSDYGITFPIDLDVRVKAVLLGAVFALDWVYSTRGGRRR